ncbi:MAG: hypothetical protein ACJ76D_08695 [Solirubrobacterales bacterium]
MIAGGLPARRACRRLLPSLIAVLAGAAALPALAAAEPLRMTDVEVEGGEDAWHTTTAFHVDWKQVPGPPATPRAVVYRLYDSNGNPVAGPVRDTRQLWTIPSLHVPPVPGVYTAEIWLEDAAGQAGPAALATLRFDDTVPAAPSPVTPAGWLASQDDARLTIDPPSGPPPVSGIGGYAIAVDRGTGGSPCAEPNWCSPRETDLLATGGRETASLGTLPEGISFARVVAVSGSGVASPVASVPIRVDGSAPRLSLQGLPEGWSNGPVHLSASATDSLSGMAAAGPTGPFTAIAVDGGAPALAFGDTASTWVAGSGLHQVSSFARDAAGNIGDDSLGASATATVAIDEEPPRVAFAAAQDPAEPERIEATVADDLSGPSPARGWVRVRPAGSHAGFEQLPTRVAGDRLIAHWDSDAYQPGKYEFLATGYDRAGNAGTGADRARGAKMVLLNPLKEPVALEAGFGGGQPVHRRCNRSRRARRCRRQAATGLDEQAPLTVPFNHGARFGGRVTGEGGRAIGGLEVAVRETFAAGSNPRQRTTMVRTQPDGTFALQLAPGPSRDVLASFAGSGTLTRAAARSVHLGVLTAVDLRASTGVGRVGGAPVVFTGSVDGTGLAAPAQGLAVELQFRYPGAGWSEFRSVETDARGRFRYAYRFSDEDSRGVRFQFRAYVKGREGWPYEPAFSHPLAVTGR